MKALPTGPLLIDALLKVRVAIRAMSTTALRWKPKPECASDPDFTFDPDLASVCFYRELAESEP